MKKVFLVLAVLFALISVVFTVLPLDTMALIPIVPALVFSLLAFRKSEGKQMHISRLTLLLSALMLVIVFGKHFFIKDIVEKDTQFEQKKADSEKEAAKELESDGL